MRDGNHKGSGHSSQESRFYLIGNRNSWRFLRRDGHDQITSEKDHPCRAEEHRGDASFLDRRKEDSVCAARCRMFGNRMAREHLAFCRSRGLFS